LFFSYLRRELFGRKKQTIIVATGMALAIALVIIVNAVALGVKSAQASVLESVYGVGTDMTVSLTPAPPGTNAQGGQKFDIGAGTGTVSGGSQKVSTSRLTAGPFAAPLPSTDLKTIQGISGVKAAAATLKLDNVTFSGQLPDQNRTVRVPGSTGARQAPGAPEGPDQQIQVAPSGGTDGKGGSSFNIDRFSVLGVDPAGAIVGPLSTIVLKSGVALSAADAGKDNAVVDATYATNNKLDIGGTLSLGGTTFTIVGIVANSTSDSSTSSDVYIPLDVAQTLSGNTDALSTVYVQASDSTQIASVQTAIQTALTGTTVKTQADLASSVSGSLATASSLLEGLGLWLSIAVLVAAFLIAILFTTSGVTRRTREFGTLKAIGWTNARITGQVAGESVIQGLIGGVIGIVLGVAGVLIINVIHPVLSGSASLGGFGFGGGRRAQAAEAANQGAQAAAGLGGGMPPGMNVEATTNIALQAPITWTVILVAVGLAVVGGVLAGAFGGWRASRLSPAEALRSVN
jgi:ABC-type antimicrobial peptide transport system permease subunit